MNTNEFKYRFSVLFNNIMSDAAPGMTDFEISYYLTKGQLELVKDYINPKGNKYQEGLDGSRKRQADFSALIQTIQLDEICNAQVKLDPRSSVYEFPASFLAVLNESLSVCYDGKPQIRQIVPLSYDEYFRLMSGVYKEPLKNQAWRLYTDADQIELITPNVDRSRPKIYTIRYVKYPTPIIVSDLSELNSSLKIDGYYKPMTSQLNEELHEEIVQRAVELAKATYASDQSGQLQMQNQITVGQRSE